MDRHNITSGFVEDALECLRIRGIDPVPILAAAGLPDKVEAPVTNIEYGHLWWQIAQTINDEFFGLAARPMRPGSFNLLVRAVLHSGSLERALHHALQFLTIVLDEPAGKLHVQDGLATITLRDRGGPRSAFAYRAYWLILMGIACWLVGRRIALRHLDFACPAPPNRQDYHQFFGAPVLFDQAVTSLSFSSSYLSLPIVRSDAAMESFLREAPANILIRYRHDNDLSSRIKSRLNRISHSDWPGIDELARELGMSTATMRRRLRGEGESFVSIKDELRFARAQALLGERRLSIAEIAGELGYSEPSAFYRAFLGWSGQTPASFRKKQDRKP